MRAFLLVAALALAAASGATQNRKVAITFDDLPRGGDGSGRIFKVAKGRGLAGSQASGFSEMARA
jgi:peptidoglycan/xylan/chitin deacetylase (PgdA/CDA1 family)